MKRVGVLILVLLAALLCAANAAPQKTAIFWMCLERCQETKDMIQKNLDEIIDLGKSGLITGVSFEIYNLVGNSTLHFNDDLSSVHEEIQRQAPMLETYAMVSSFPYPPEFTNWMREVFAKPDPFIDQCISEAKKHKFTGYNIDFEPVAAITEQDAADYAKFLDYLAKRFHENGLKVSMDFAGWSKLWNMRLLEKTDTDYLLDMATYTGNITVWTNAFMKAVSEIGVQKLGIGLESENPNTKSPLTAEDLRARFALINKYQIRNVAVWKMDNFYHQYKSSWRDELKNFMSPAPKRNN